MNITSHELARLCNVSRATVDRVFNNRGKVNEETRRKILETAKSVGYRPNSVARSLTTGRTRSIGVVFPGLINYFFSALLDAVSRKAQREGYTTLVTLYEEGPAMEQECVMSLLERRVDGLIVFSTSPMEKASAFYAGCGVPVVPVLNELAGLPCVDIDFEQAMYDITRYVLSKEYKRLILLSPPLEYEGEQNIFAIRQRYEGFRKAMDGPEGRAASGDVISSADYEDRLYASRFDSGEKTAILCSSDIYALKVIKLLKTRGLRIPMDVGVSGFDGIDVLSYLEPSMATVEIPITALGERAVDYLIDVIERGESPLQTRLCHLIRPGQSII